MTTYNIRNKDQQTTPQKFMLKERIKAVAILDNLRSAYNTGSIFRTADTVRLGKLFLCGSTPTPLNPKLVKTSLGAEEFVPWEYFTKTEEAIKRLKEDNYFIVSMETADGAENLFKTELPEKIAFIFGNEKDGLQSEFLELSDKVIELPACGMKNSLNVANAFSATIYEYFRRYGDNLLNG